MPRGGVEVEEGWWKGRRRGLVAQTGKESMLNGRLKGGVQERGGEGGNGDGKDLQVSGFSEGS